MKKFNLKDNKGFTLIETMIAVFILVIAMNALLGLISSSLFSARYAKNNIVANYLVQEVIDYIRNDRDSIAFQQISEPSGGWANFQAKYSACFTAEGCEIEPAKLANNINVCTVPPSGNFGTLDCKILNYDDTGSGKNFYTYENPIGSTPSNFKRQVTMSLNTTIPNADELDIKVTVEWRNGNLVRSRSSRISLLNWQQ